MIGAVPVYVDIDPDNYNLDPLLLEASITTRTKAIVPVSLLVNLLTLLLLILLRLSTTYLS